MSGIQRIVGLTSFLLTVWWVFRFSHALTTWTHITDDPDLFQPDAKEVIKEMAYSSFRNLACSFIITVVCIVV